MPDYFIRTISCRFMVSKESHFFFFVNLPVISARLSSFRETQ